MFSYNATPVVLPVAEATANNQNFWFLFLVPLPVLTIVGNCLIAAVVLRERSLRNPTNFLLVSLAIADMLVGICVMPPSIYVAINNFEWNLPSIVCDLFNIFDVAASTASILNLVAVSIERFYAVVRNVKYRSGYHLIRIRLTVILVWIFSFATGLSLPLAAHKSETPPSLSDVTIIDNIDHKCHIDSIDYIFYASIFCFFFPCLVMLVMYGFVFYYLYKRLRSIRLQEMAAGHMVSFNTNLNRVMLAANGRDPQAIRRKTLSWALPFLRELEESVADDDDVSMDDVAELTSIFHTLETDANYLSRTSALRRSSRRSKRTKSTSSSNCGTAQDSLANSNSLLELPRDSEPFLKLNLGRLPSECDGDGSEAAISVTSRQHLPFLQRIAHNVVTKVRNQKNSAASGEKSKQQFEADASKNAEKSSTTSSNGRSARITRMRMLKQRALALIMKLRHKEGQQVRKETRATKLVAAVLAVFLVCWFPFFVLNLIKSFKLAGDDWSQELEFMFHLFTWLGYINSCLNPAVYSMVNRRFRQKLAKLLGFREQVRPCLREHLDYPCLRKPDKSSFGDVHNMLMSLTTQPPPGHRASTVVL